MFRRSRFSARPNVGTAGRTAATPQEAPSSNQEASETSRDVSESISEPSVIDNKSVVTPSEKSTGPGDGSDQNGEGSSSSAAVQRRKRFSIKPKVAPGRPATLARTLKSPVKAVSETPVEASGSDFDKPATSSQTSSTADSQGLKSPRRRRLSENVKQPKVQPKPTSTPSVNSTSLAVPPAEDSLEQTQLPADSGKQLEITSGSKVKEVPPRPPDRIPHFIPDKEAIELSEKAKTLVSSKSGLSLSPSALSLSRLLNDPSDLQRLAKAQKLRELLRQERHKEKKLKKAKTHLKEYTLDPAKMTMRDLIHYLPMSNPMTSSLECSTEENETVVPASPVREDRSPERAQEPEVAPKISQMGEENEEGDEDQEEALMVPQVKVAEDGSLIIDEESLTVEVQRAKGPNPAQDRDPIFERGSTTTYSSFRKGTCSKPWSNEETDMFFLAVSMVGTDFSMICQLFPHRARAEIKNKFKREERENAWRIDKAFRERRKLDIEYFSKLLEKILEVQKNRKKLKSLAVKNSPKKQKKKKAKGKIAARKLSDVDEEDENHPDLEDEEGGEKENELLCNEGEATASNPKKQRKRKTGKDASNEEPSNKKNNTSVEKSIEQGEPCIPEDTEAALLEEPRNSDISEKSDKVNTNDTAVKPAKLSRGRAPKPLVPLGRKWGKKVPPPSTEAKASGEDCVSDGASKEQVNEDASSSRISDNDISSEEEEAPVPPPRPTRYGRVPKPTKILTYPCKEDEHSSASETTSSSPVQHTAPKRTMKRGRSSVPQSDQESKKPKLVTLRASPSDYSDEENDQQWEQEEDEEEQNPACSSNKDSIAPAFVPTSLRAPHSKMSVVEEAMEELDILANMPDVLGISQDALCPDASCEQAQNETGTAEPCEHQLDLLVDVIDFLSSEQGEVSEDENYNEAAQTLLTIGNLTHLFQETQNQITTQDHITGTTSNSETSQHLEGEIPSNPAAHEQSANPCICAASDNGVTETSETIATLEQQNSTADSGDTEQICIEQWTDSDKSHTPQLQSNPESLEKDFSFKLCQTSMTAHLTSQTETSAVNKPVIESVPEEAAPKIPECSPPSLKGISCAEIRLTEKPSGSQEKSPQSHCSSSGQFKSNLEHTNQETVALSSTKDEIIEGDLNNLAASDTSVMSVEQGSNTDSVLAREGSHDCTGFVSPVGDLHVSREQESEVASALQSRRSGLQKVKPKPNLSQTSRTGRSKPQVTKNSTERNCSPPPIAETVAEVKPEQTSATPPEKSTESTSTASDLTPLLDLAEDKNTDDSVPVQEGSHHCSGFVPPVEDLPLSQKGKNEVASTSQSRRSRSQKVITKPNLPQTFRSARPKPQTTKDSIEKDFSTTPDVKPEQTCATLPDKTTQSTGPASDFIPSLDLSSVLIPTEEFSTTEVKNIDVGLSGQVGSSSSIATSGQGASEDQNFSKVQVQLEKANGVTRPMSESTEYHCSNLVTSGSAVTELNIRQGSHSNTPSRPESSDSTVAEVEAKPMCSTIFPERSSQSIGTTSVSVLSLELCTTHQPTEIQKADAGFGLDSSSENSEPNVPQRRRRFPKVKPKPNLASSPRTTRSTLHPKGISKTSELHHMDTSSNVKIEHPSVDKNGAQTELEPTETASKNLISVLPSLSTELIDSTKSAATELNMSLDSTNILATSWVAENCFMLTDSVSENKSSEKSTGDKMSNNPEVGVELSSQGYCTVDVSTRPPELNTQRTDDLVALSNIQLSQDGSTESKINSTLTTNVNSSSNQKESSHQSCPKSDSEDKSQDAAQQCSETSEMPNNISQSAHSSDESQSTDSSVSSRKAPPTRRGRLIKPRPNLGRSQLLKPQPVVQNTTQAEADSGTCSGGVIAVSQNLVSELRPDREPVPHSRQDSRPDYAGSSLGCMKLAVEQLGQDDRSSNDVGSSLGSLPQVPSTQNASEGDQSYPCLTLFPDMLSEQVPSDPDEPFFILSLTEIPVSSSGEVVDSAAEPFSYLPETDASVPQQSSLPGETLEAAGDVSLSDAPMTITTEESGEMSLTSVKDTGLDPTTRKDLIMKNPVDADAGTTVHPSKFPESVENNNDTEIPKTKQRLRGTGRGAKLQVKTTKERTKQASKTLTPDTIQVPRNRGPSVQPEASDATTKAGKIVTEPHKGSGDHVDIQKETLTCAKDSTSGAPTLPTKTRVARSQSRKSKDSVSLLSETNSADDPPMSSNVRTPHAAGKRSTTTPHQVAPTPSLTQLPDEAHSTLSTTSPTQTEVAIKQNAECSSRCPDPTTRPSQCTAEVSVSQQSDYVESSSVEEEPTNVSQYFLSDIFTEVEEG